MQHGVRQHAGTRPRDDHSTDHRSRRTSPHGGSGGGGKYDRNQPQHQRHVRHRLPRGWRCARGLEYQPTGQGAGDQPRGRAVECERSDQRLQLGGQRRCDPGCRGIFRGPGGTSAGEFHSIPPLRICDTRAKQGTVCAGSDQQPAHGDHVGRGVAQGGALRAAPGAPGGTPSIPATGAAGAAFNLTATGGTKATLLAVQAPNSADLCPTTRRGSPT